MKAFTLLEIKIMALVIAFVLIITIPLYFRAAIHAVESKAIDNLQEIKKIQGLTQGTWITFCPTQNVNISVDMGVDFPGIDGELKFYDAHYTYAVAKGSDVVEARVTAAASGEVDEFDINLTTGILKRYTRGRH